MNTFRDRQTLICILSASLLLLALFPARLTASALTLAWDPNTEVDLAGYKIYYGTRSGDYDFVLDVGNRTYYTVRGLEPETRYYLALTAYDFSGNESDFSAEVSAISGDEPDPAPFPNYPVMARGGGGCFIATSAYGSYLDPRVKILRGFRDKFLFPNSLGRKFVYLYYHCAPRVAKHVREYGFLRFVNS